MNGWVVALCVASVGCGILVSLRQKEDGAVRFLCSLVLLSVLFAPLPKLLASVSLDGWFAPTATEDEPDLSQSWIFSAAAEQIGETVADEAVRLCGVSRDDVHMRFTLDCDDVRAIAVKRVTVDLRTANVLYGVDELKKALENALGCEISILVR